MTSISSGHWERMHYEQFMQELVGHYDEDVTDNMDKLVEQIQILEKFSLDSKRVFCLFSQVDFYFTYVSENVENVIGFSAERIYRGGLSLAFKMVHWQQLPLAIKVHQWGEKFLNLVKHATGRKNQGAFFCGLKMRDNKGQLRTFFIKQKILSFEKNSKKPLLSFLEVEEITTIFKGDFLWVRFTATYNQQDYCRVFLSKGKKKEYADLLSEREMEILQLVTQQKNNIEISKALGISKNTVERHRKNMIARAGVVDMTGLIYVCRLCQIL